MQILCIEFVLIEKRLVKLKVTRAFDCITSDIEPRESWFFVSSAKRETQACSTLHARVSRIALIARLNNACYAGYVALYAIVLRPTMPASARQVTNFTPQENL